MLWYPNEYSPANVAELSTKFRPSVTSMTLAWPKDNLSPVQQRKQAIVPARSNLAGEDELAGNAQQIVDLQRHP